MNHNVISFFYTHRSALMAPLCMVQALVGALGGTMGCAVAQQASTSHYMGVHLYNFPAPNKT